MAVDRSDPGWPGAFCLFPWVEQSFDIHGNLHLCNRSTTIYGDKGEQITVERPGGFVEHLEWVGDEKGSTSDVGGNSTQSLWSLY